MSKNRQIGLRLHDIAEGLKDIAPTGYISKYKNTMLIGKAAILALHLKGHDVIQNFEALEYTAAELGISNIELDIILTELEEIEFIRKFPKKIEIIVPTFIDAYEILGTRWQELKPNEIELKTVNILTKLENNPQKTKEIIDYFDLNEDENRIIYEIGGAGTYLDTFYTTIGESITFSPTLTELHPEKIYNFTQKHPDSELSNIYEEIRTFQGKPLEQVTDKIIKEACYSGILLQTEIIVGKERCKYLFAPIDNVKQENKIIIDKARAILSCVRCGEFHTPDSTKILSPYHILRAMRDRKKLSSNTSHRSQYGLIITKGIAKLANPEDIRSELQIVDTEENLNALDLSMEMLGHKHDSVLRKNNDLNINLFNPSNYSNPASTRVKYKKEILSSKQTSDDIINKISQINQGIYNAYE